MESPADRQFRVRVQSKALCRIRSDELHQAARVVWSAGLLEFESSNGERDEFAILYRPAQLLMGLSLEALLKGLAISRNQTLVAGNSLPKVLKDHSLLRLFALASLEPPRTEEGLRLLRQLSDAVEWVSKYPVPTTAKHLETTKHGDSDPLAQFHHTFPLYEEIRATILEHYPELGA